jgi:hypothetical protein
VNILFVGLVAALSLAFGLAFGLGGREVAGRLTEEWYEQTRSAARKIQGESTGPSSPATVRTSSARRP